jgi:hypothetical protein
MVVGRTTIGTQGYPQRVCRKNTAIGWKAEIFKTRRKAIMMNWNIDTIANEHNYSVEYIYVPFRDALLMGKSN